MITSNLKSLTYLFLVPSSNKLHLRCTVYTTTQLETLPTKDTSEVLDRKGKGKIPAEESSRVVSPSNDSSSSSSSTTPPIEEIISAPTTRPLPTTQELHDQIDATRTRIKHLQEILKDTRIENQTDLEASSSTVSENDETANVSQIDTMEERVDATQLLKDTVLLKEKIKRLTLTLQGLHITVDETLKNRQIELPKTENATKRAQSILNRAEEFLRSIENPGRTAFYCVTALAAAYSFYNILRYGQLPFVSLLGGGARSLPTSVSSTVAPIVSPVCNPVINISYPTPNIPSVATSGSFADIFNTTTITISIISVTIVALAFILKKAPK